MVANYYCTIRNTLNLGMKYCQKLEPNYTAENNLKNYKNRVDCVNFLFVLGHGYPFVVRIGACLIFLMPIGQKCRQSPRRVTFFCHSQAKNDNRSPQRHSCEMPVICACGRYIFALFFYPTPFNLIISRRYMNLDSDYIWYEYTTTHVGHLLSVIYCW